MANAYVCSVYYFFFVNTGLSKKCKLNPKPVAAHPTGTFQYRTGRNQNQL